MAVTESKWIRIIELYRIRQIEADGMSASILSNDKTSLDETAPSDADSKVQSFLILLILKIEEILETFLISFQT